MRAVVLVGGIGSRLRPLTLTRPKQLMPVANRPMLDHVVEHLVAHGVTDVVLSLGYRPDAFREAYPDGVCAGARLELAVEEEPLGTGGAIRFAAEQAGIDETFVVCNGDVLTDMDVSRLVALHHASGALGTIHLMAVEDPTRFGLVATDSSGRVSGFVEKPRPGTATTNLVNAGTYVMEPELLERIPATGPASIERDTFPVLAAAGVLQAHHLPGHWIDAGTPATLIEANVDRYEPGADGARELLSWVAPDATVAEGAELERTVAFPGAAVAAGAIVKDSLIGWGAEVGEDAVVIGSVLGEGAVVDPGEKLDGVRRPA